MAAVYRPRGWLRELIRFAVATWFVGCVIASIVATGFIEPELRTVG